MCSPSHVIRVRKVRQVLLCLSPSLCRRLAASQNHSYFTVCVLESLDVCYRNIRKGGFLETFSDSHDFLFHLISSYFCSHLNF